MMGGDEKATLWTIIDCNMECPLLRDLETFVAEMKSFFQFRSSRTFFALVNVKTSGIQCYIINSAPEIMFCCLLFAVILTKMNP